MIKLTKPDLSSQFEDSSIEEIYINMITNLLEDENVKKELNKELKKQEIKLNNVKEKFKKTIIKAKLAKKELEKQEKKVNDYKTTQTQLELEIKTFKNLLNSKNVVLCLLKSLSICENKTDEEIIRFFFTLSSDELKQLKDKYYRNTDTKSTDQIRFRVFINIYEQLRDKIYKKRKFSYIFSECSGVKVCPYCNRNFINNAEDEEKGYQSLELDHSIPKSEYPIFALSINNFIPSCGPCNRRKSTTEFQHSLYSDNKELKEPKFRVFRGGDSTFKIEDSDFFDYIDAFKIKEFYQMHNDEVRNIENRILMYPEEKVIEIAKILKKEYNKDFYVDVIFGLYLTDDILNTPLGKFKREIVEDLLNDIKLANS